MLLKNFYKHHLFYFSILFGVPSNIFNKGEMHLAQMKAKATYQDEKDVLQTAAFISYTLQLSFLLYLNTVTRQSKTKTIMSFLCSHFINVKSAINLSQ